MKCVNHVNPLFLTKRSAAIEEGDACNASLNVLTHHPFKHISVIFLFPASNMQAVLL